MTTVHVPVMGPEAIEGLRIRPGGIYVDGTFGGGGHTRLILERVGPTGIVVAIDRDAAAIAHGLAQFSDPRVRFFHANFRFLPDVLEQLRLGPVDGVLLDLGISSDQLADPQRGFSYDATGPLDLRMDVERGEPAWQLLQRLDERELADLIYRYGEERFSRRVARRIVERRDQEPLRTAHDLAELVRSCVPRSRGHAIDPATRTFQALRIAVNQEIEGLEEALSRIPDCLAPGGRFVVISFHSLEDRPVKQAFRSDPRLLVLTKKPIAPNQAEVWTNPRARSAKMRIAERK